MIAGALAHPASPGNAFERAFMDEASASLGRRASLALSVTGRHVYLDVDGKGFDSAIRVYRLGI